MTESNPKEKMKVRNKRENIYSTKAPKDLSDEEILERIDSLSEYQYDGSCYLMQKPITLQELRHLNWKGLALIILQRETVFQKMLAERQLEDEEKNKLEEKKDNLKKLEQTVIKLENENQYLTNKLKAKLKPCFKTLLKTRRISDSLKEKIGILKIKTKSPFSWLKIGRENFSECYICHKKTKNKIIIRFASEERYTYSQTWSRVCKECAAKEIKKRIESSAISDYFFKV